MPERKPLMTFLRGIGYLKFPYSTASVGRVVAEAEVVDVLEDTPEKYGRVQRTPQGLIRFF